MEQTPDFAAAPGLASQKPSWRAYVREARDCLASRLLGRPGTIWAALSTSGIRGLRLPPQPGGLTIAPDGDTAGREAANALAERAHGLGWQVSLLPAPDGRDWNDILTGKAVAA